MMYDKRSTILFSFLFAITTLLLLTMPLLAQLPPRPAIDPKPSPELETPPGATIHLAIENPLPNLWTEVQWQDAHSGWHTVDGWRGTLDDGVNKRWWVAPKDYDTGPFRWLVYEDDDGLLLFASTGFYLPAADRQTLRITVSLPER